MIALLLGLVTVVVATAVCIGGVLVVRKFVSFEELKKHHEVAGYLISVIGTLYAVLLGLVIIDAQTNVAQARLVVEQEANSLVDIFVFTRSFPDLEKKRLQLLCLQYAESVINEEWDLMARSERPSPRLMENLRQMWQTIGDFEPKTESQKAFYSAIITEMSNLGDNRRARWVASRNQLSPVLWVALLVGGVITVVFSYFFGLENVRAQIVMTVLLAVTLSLNVFVVAVFSMPFQGEFTVSPDPFVIDRELFKRLMKSQ